MALAAATHWHESTVRRRIEELQQAGIVYFDVDLDHEILGFHVHAMLWASVEPAHLAAAGQAMAAHPQAPFVAATTGPTNLAASCAFRDMSGLYDYLTTELAALPGVRSVESAPIIGTVKKTSTLSVAQGAGAGR